MRVAEREMQGMLAPVVDGGPADASFPDWREARPHVQTDTYFIPDCIVGYWGKTSKYCAALVAVGPSGADFIHSLGFHSMKLGSCLALSSWQITFHGAVMSSWPSVLQSFRSCFEAFVLRLNT